MVKSYVPEKRFGFIQGADGRSYFFHANDFKPRLAADATIDSALVLFDPTPTPKGLAAKGLSLAREQAVEWLPPDEFIFSRDNGPKKARIFLDLPAIKASGTDAPDQVRAELRRIASAIGANAVLGVEYTKTTGESGNYKFSIHNVSGRPAIVMMPKMTSDLTAAETSEQRSRQMAEALLAGYNKYLDHLAELERQRKMRERFILGGVLCALLLFVWLLVR